MRKAFVQELLRIAETDGRIILLAGDLGFGVLDPFRAQLPKQFVNVGVAEQNMTGVAAGLALRGRIAITYSIGNFSAVRCLEQIRNDVCYPRLPVKIVAVGAGLSYGTHGFSHFAIEDVAIMRALPGLTILSPGDDYEVKESVRDMIALPGPCYLRLAGASHPPVHPGPIASSLAPLVIRPVQERTLVTTGALLRQAMDAVLACEQTGTSVGLVSIPCVKPLPWPALASLLASRCTELIVAEEHSGVGGLLSAIAEAQVQASSAPSLRLRGLSLPPFLSTQGSRDFLLHEHGLSPSAIAATLKGAFP